MKQLGLALNKIMMSRSLVPYKKAFSLIEVIIATSLLSVVMLALFQINSNNIYLVEKPIKSKKQRDLLLVSIDTQEYKKRNENIYLDKLFDFYDDDIRRDFKQFKIKVKDELTNSFERQLTNNTKVNITKYKTKYSFENGISKNILRVKLDL